MERISQTDFQARFRRPGAAADAPDAPTVVADRDLRVGGTVGEFVVRDGATVVITGLIERSLTVDRGGVAFVEGLVDGSIVVHGALCVDGGHLAGRVSGNGVLYDSIP